MDTNEKMALLEVISQRNKEILLKAPIPQKHKVILQFHMGKLWYVQKQKFVKPDLLF